MDVKFRTRVAPRVPFRSLNPHSKMLRQDVHLHPPEIRAKGVDCQTLAWSERAVASLITMNTQVPCIKSTVTDAIRSGSEMA